MPLKDAREEQKECCGAALLELEKSNSNEEEVDQGAVTLVVDLARAFEHVQLKVACAWAMHHGVPQRMLRVSCWYFQHQRRVRFEGCVAQDAMSEVWKA